MTLRGTMLRYVLAFATAGAVVVPLVAQAQGLVGGSERGYDAGRRALGPIGGVVGGVVGAGVGTVNGALGIGPRYRRGYYGRRCIYRLGRRYCR